MAGRAKSLRQVIITKGGAGGAKRKRKVSLRQAGVRTVGICGVGLIGGSIAERLQSKSLLLQSKRIDLRILGYDRENVLQEAVSEKVIDGAARPEVMLQECDLIILSANPFSNQKILSALSRRSVSDESMGRPLIVDTGSTQSGIADLAKSLQWNNGATFVAGHPMAGREVQGIESRMADLFEGRPFFFDQAVELSLRQRLIIEWFTGELGAFPMYVENENHDSVMTDISHIPQLLSTVMGGFVSHHDQETIHLAGTGLQSMIRLGGSPYSNWHDVFKENSERMCERLDVLIDDLIQVRKQIDAGESLQKSFKKAKRGYSCLW